MIQPVIECSSKGEETRLRELLSNAGVVVCPAGTEEETPYDDTSKVTALPCDDLANHESMKISVLHMKHAGSMDPDVVAASAHSIQLTGSIRLLECSPPFTTTMKINESEAKPQDQRQHHDVSSADYESKTSGEFTGTPTSLTNLASTDSIDQNDSIPTTARGATSTPQFIAGDMHWVYCPAVPVELSLAAIIAYFDACMPYLRTILVLNHSTPCTNILFQCTSARASVQFRDAYAGQAYHPHYAEACVLLPTMQPVVYSIATSPRLITSTSGATFYKLAIGHRLKRQLPTCPICLDRLDLNELDVNDDPIGFGRRIEGREFKSRTWRDLTCLVCSEIAGKGVGLRCNDCSANTDLWACLACGRVGCSRQLWDNDAPPSQEGNAHSLRHFQDTNELHSLTIQISSGHVWDYLLDKYVHHVSEDPLIQDSTKTTSDSARRRKSMRASPFGGGIDSADVSSEYASLLATQLQSQKEYFEARLLRLRNEHSEIMAARRITLERHEINASALTTTLEAEQLKLAQLHTTCKKEKEAFFATLYQLADSLQERQSMTALVQANEQEFGRNTLMWKQKLLEADQTIERLKEEKSDVLEHIQNKRKISKSKRREELDHGSIVLVPSITSPTDSIKKPGKGRGKR